MKIVFLDSATIGPEDLDLTPLLALGEVVLHPTTGRADVLARLAGADVALLNKTPLDAETLAQLPDLRYVGVAATGTNIVDVAAARSRGIVVTNVPGYSTMSVVQTAFGLLFELTHGIGRHSAWVRGGGWAAHPMFVHWDKPLVEVAGLTFGVIGYGAIGRSAARVAEAFGMRVLALDRGKELDVERAPLDELLARSDVVSLHCPQTTETAGMVDVAFLGRMEPTAFLLNTARGGLVVESDLAAALVQGTIAGAGLDVLSTEPPRSDNPLLLARNCVVTPHFAWASLAARRRLFAELVANVAAFAEGNPRNVVG